MRKGMNEVLFDTGFNDAVAGSNRKAGNGSTRCREGSPIGSKTGLPFYEQKPLAFVL
jgi:hypothetical protein